jgi:hypothetical protein
LAPVLFTKFSTRLKNDTTDYFTTEKNNESSSLNYIVVYNKLPTVSYRANHLGINTKEPSAKTDASITIGAYNERHIIYLKSSEHEAMIDLETGSLIDFIVDCGSWNGVPGGIIPGKNDPMSGLAKIAYTGEIADLEQDDTTTIIFFDGGSASEI